MIKRIYKAIYAKFSRFILGHKMTAFSEVIIIGASGYFLVKKGFGLSISGWLLNNALHQSAVNTCVLVGGIIIVLAIFIKILSLLFLHYPATKHSAVEPEEISECLQVMNREILSHIEKCDSDTSPNLRKIRDQHSFDVNSRLITESLAEHVMKAVTNIKVKRKDIFISLYTFNKADNSLTYELHYDPRRDLVQSKYIDLNDGSYSGYECVKCIKSAASTAS